MTVNRIDQLAAQFEPRLRSAFLKAIYDTRDAAQIGAIAAKLERGDIDGALSAVGIDPARFRDLDTAITAAFEAGGRFTAGQIPGLRDDDGARLKIVFDVRNPAAEQWLRGRSSTLIREIVDDQREMARGVLVQGMTAGANPRQTAIDLVGRVDPASKRRVGGAIGLTSSQEQWVRAYRAELADPKTMQRALERKLRDQRFDRTVMRAVREGRSLTTDEVDAMVRNYRNRALKYRADGIARTESIRAMNQAQIEASRQAIRAGQVDAAAMVKVWIATSDGRTRDTHAAMDGQEVGVDDPFVSPSGARLAYPGDPSAPAHETINCRCTMVTRVDFLRGIR
jgi:hypothetical protein